MSSPVSVAQANVIATTDILIDAPPAAVWAALAEDFAGIGKWSSGVADSRGFGDPIGGSPHCLRACEITAAGFADTKERILDFDRAQYRLRYSLYDGLPGFVEAAENTWRLRPEGGGTRISGTTRMRATGPLGFLMRGMMRKATRNVLERMGAELKHYVETGRPHPDKLAAQSRAAEKFRKRRKRVTSFAIRQEVTASVDRVWEVIARDFGEVHRSHPVSHKSALLPGFDRAQKGAMRIMYLSGSEKKYFVDKIAELDEQEHRMTVEVTEAAGYPVVAGHTWVDFALAPRPDGNTDLELRFTYLTKPALLKGLAKGSLKKRFSEYARAIAHHAVTGEDITRESWARISK